MRVSQFRFYPSIHGVILLLLHAYLLVGPVLQENDLVAAALVCCFAIVNLVAFILTLVCGIRTRRSIQITFYPVVESAHDNFTANEPCLIDIQPTLKLFAGVQAKLLLRSELPGAPQIRAAYHDSKEWLTRTLTLFPHRGNWTLGNATIKISDLLGLWNARIEIVLQEQSLFVPIKPEAFIDGDFPIIQSTEREGDSSISNQQAASDLYDVKRYHPSDGMRKIVWKVFARTGELLSRHPEPTMTPEGKSIIFACGGAPHDGAYSSAAHYAQLREQEGFEVLLSGSTFPNDTIAKTSGDFLQIAISSAFHAPTIDPLNQLMTSAISEGGVLKQVALFVDLNCSIDESISLAEEAIKTVEDAGLTPVVMMVSDEPLAERISNKKKSTSFGAFKNLFTEQEGLNTQKEDVDKIVQFIQYCESNRWQVA